MLVTVVKRYKVQGQRIKEKPLSFDLCGFAAFSHSTFDVGHSMLDVHLGSGLSGLWVY